MIHFSLLRSEIKQYSSNALYFDRHLLMLSRSKSTKPIEALSVGIDECYGLVAFTIKQCSLRNVNQIRDTRGTAIIGYERGRGRDHPKFSVSPERIASQETGKLGQPLLSVAPEVSSASLHKNWSVRSSIRSMYQCDVHKIMYKRMGMSIGSQNLPHHLTNLARKRHRR